MTVNDYGNVYLCLFFLLKQVCLELAGFGTKMDGKLQRRCTTIVREDGRKEAEWSTVDITKCCLSMTALQLCENSLNLVSNPS